MEIEFPKWRNLNSNSNGFHLAISVSPSAVYIKCSHLEEYRSSRSREVTYSATTSVQVKASGGIFFYNKRHITDFKEEAGDPMLHYWFS